MLDALFSEELTVRDKLEAHINKTEIAYKADHNLDRVSKRVFKLFKKALADFSESNRGYNAYNVSGERVERYAYAGEGARTANNSLLKKAKSMLKSGTTSEDVRKATGWFKGYDGKWRFEIDDSVAVWHLDTARPDPKRLFNFGERILNSPTLLIILRCLKHIPS